MHMEGAPNMWMLWSHAGSPGSPLIQTLVTPGAHFWQNWALVSLENQLCFPSELPKLRCEAMNRVLCCKLLLAADTQVFAAQLARSCRSLGAASGVQAQRGCLILALCVQALWGDVHAAGMSLALVALGK